MGCNVYANTNEIACKAGAGKVIAAFPDVCLSPPSPPAGPLPVPYPNSSFSKDMKNGSKSVKIKKKPVMLKNKSFYKSSPLGDEAATKSLGAGVVTHTITGKTYFNAWSMDVKFEGQNVDRNSDITTSNHASPMANASVPWFNISEKTMEKAEKGKCPCCDAAQHMPGTIKDGETWYRDNNPGREAEVQALLDRTSRTARIKAGCSCWKKKPPPKVVPEDPCNVFIQPEDRESYRVAKAKMDDDYKAMQAKWKDSVGVTPRSKLGGKKKPSTARSARHQEIRQGNHLTPRGAGGCPVGTGNLAAMERLCDVCQQIDREFKAFQTPQFPPVLE